MAPCLMSAVCRNRRKILLLLAIMAVAAFALTISTRKLRELKELWRYERPNGKGNVKTVLFWGKCYHKEWSKSYMMQPGQRSCGTGRLQCLFTDNRDLYDEADAVVFHAVSDNLTDIPNLSLRPHKQRWVFHNMEAYYNHTFNRKPWLVGLFNWTHTFLSSSDVPIPYGWITQGGNLMGGFDSNHNYLEGRTKSVVALISDCARRRLKFVTRLSKYIDVVVYGRCGIGGCPRKTKECWDTVRTFKFYLALENHVCNDYVTEKLYINALRHMIVPVVLGGANYSNHIVAPPSSYINALEFDSVEDLALYLHHVGSNPQLYNSYFHWHSQYTVHYHLDNTMHTFCDLCEALHDRSRPHKHYPNVIKWFENARNCTPYPQGIT